MANVINKFISKHEKIRTHDRGKNIIDRVWAIYMSYNCIEKVGLAEFYVRRNFNPFHQLLPPIPKSTQSRAATRRYRQPFEKAEPPMGSGNQAILRVSKAALSFHFLFH